MTGNPEIIKIFLSHGNKIMDTETVDKLLSNKKEIIGEGATSTVYKVDNYMTHKGFLCLKILKKAVVGRIDSSEASKSKKKSFWSEEEETSESKKESEIELNFDFVKILFSEYEILNCLHHPNIVKAHGFYLGDPTHNPAILLEYCKFNLGQVIHQLEDFELVGVIYEICSAMKHVHSKNIIHRDLKMANILINLKKHVKICDFGIAKGIDLETYTSLTHGVGTLAFMAPEIFDENIKYNEKVDVYSFGVILFFILTKGKMPKFLKKEKYESLSLPNSINELSCSIIKRCWSLSPEERPSFEEILNLTVSNNFMLIDGIEDEIPQLKKHLGLE